MPEILTVAQGLEKVRELAEQEKDKKSGKTRITVKGELSWVATELKQDGRMQDITLKQDCEDKPRFLQVTLFDVKRKDGNPWNGVLPETDVGKEITVTGTANEFRGQHSLFAMRGTGESKRSGGGKGNPRAFAVNNLFNAAMAQFPPIDLADLKGDQQFEVVIGKRIDIALRAVTPERVSNYIACAYSQQNQKTEEKSTQESEESPSEDKKSGDSLEQDYSDADEPRW